MKCLTLLFIFFQFNATGQKTILWQINDTTNNKISYLLGTLHQMGNSFVDSIPKIINTLKSSEFGIFESIDDPNLLITKINAREDNSETIKFLKHKDFSALKQTAKGWKVNIHKLSSFEIFFRLRQSLPLVICENAKPTDSFTHFDNYLIYQSQQNNIPIVGLESDSLQLAYLSESFPSKYTKNERKGILQVLKILTEKNKSGYDCEGSEKYKKMDIDYQLQTTCSEDILIKKRNEKWMPIIESYIQNKNCFIAVGLMHLMYDCGIISQLRKKGFLVNPILLH